MTCMAITGKLAYCRARTVPRCLSRLEYGALSLRNSQSLEEAGNSALGRLRREAHVQTNDNANSSRLLSGLKERRGDRRTVVRRLRLGIWTAAHEQPSQE